MRSLCISIFLGNDTKKKMLCIQTDGTAICVAKNLHDPLEFVYQTSDYISEMMQCKNIVITTR